MNRRGPTQLHRILERLFEHQPVEITERRVLGSPSDIVQLIDEDHVLAVSGLDHLTETVLLVNSDRGITDARMADPERLTLLMFGHPAPERPSLADSGCLSRTNAANW